MQAQLDFETDRFVLRTGPVASGSLFAQVLQVCYREKLLLPHAERQFDTQLPCAFEVPATRYKQFLSLLTYTHRNLAASAGSSEKLLMDAHVWPRPIEIALGDFECTLDELLIIDPACSSLDKGVSIPAMPGRWKAGAQANYGSYGLAMTRLMAWREPFADQSICLNLEQSDEVASCGADSGLCAIIDTASYPHDPAQFEDAVGTFYRACREATACNGDQPTIERAFPASVLPRYGVVSRTFMPPGDVSDVRVCRNVDGLAVAVGVVFSLNPRAALENLTVV